MSNTDFTGSSSFLLFFFPTSTYSWRGSESGNDQFRSPKLPFPAGIKAGESLEQLHPEAMNLYMTRNRKTKAALEKSFRNNTRMTEDLRLPS